jgi:signal transduction histidine kinase
MLLLVLVAVTRENVERPQVAGGLLAALVVWALVTSIQQLRRSTTDPWWVTLGDALLASVALVSPQWVGTEDLIYGGFPAIAVAAAAVTERRRGWLVAAILSVVTLVLLQVSDFAGLIASLGQLIAYGMIAGIVGWAAHLIYRSDRERRRAERAQASAEERSRVAAHLHDSVLQTLALIQRDAGDPLRVAALARSQERELRDWLYGPAPAAGPGLAGALRAIASEVDRAYRVEVELVIVGDAPLSEPAQALVAAGREAMVNAAKHGRGGVSVYLETASDRARLFIRDRGPGFDPGSISADRHGIRHSIEERIARAGGQAQVTSTPGQGTEVKLEVPL